MTLMGINGAVTSSVEPLTLSQIADINSIVDHRGDMVFVVTGYGTIEFASDEMEANDPYYDMIWNPLQKLIEYAKKQSILLNGSFETWSDENSYNGIVIAIADNEIRCQNKDISEASVQSLVEELTTRDKEEVLEQLQKAGIIPA